MAIPLPDDSSSATTPSNEHPFLSTSSNQSILVARTRTQSIIDRASPYNVIETSTDADDMDDDIYMRPINDEGDDDVIISEDPVPYDEEKLAATTLSPSSSLTSGTDVYMDAVEILNDEISNEKSGRHEFNNQFHVFLVISDGSLTPICYGSFSKEIIDAFSANLHRIDKDVARCDRTYSYFTNMNNLKKLRNIMCT